MPRLRACPSVAVPALRGPDRPVHSAESKLSSREAPSAQYAAAAWPLLSCEPAGLVPGSGPQHLHASRLEGCPHGLQGTRMPPPRVACPARSLTLLSPELRPGVSPQPSQNPADHRPLSLCRRPPCSLRLPPPPAGAGPEHGPWGPAVTTAVCLRLWATWVPGSCPVTTPALGLGSMVSTPGTRPYVPYAAEGEEAGAGPVTEGRAVGGSSGVTQLPTRLPNGAEVDRPPHGVGAACPRTRSASPPLGRALGPTCPSPAGAPPRPPWLPFRGERKQQPPAPV